VVDINTIQINLAPAAFLWGSLREGDHSEDPGVDGRKVLKWII
jgi:hypothetical protein